MPQTQILLLEDSDTVRGFLRRLFQNHMPDAGIHEAVEGREALRAMSRERIDLIVTDLQMPGMDGRTFIATLRNNRLLRKKSVLVLSSDDVADLRALYAADTGISFLRKPSNTEEILAAVASLLAQANPATALKEAS